MISLSKYRETVAHSENKEVMSMVNKHLANKQNVNFDDFFALEKEVLSAQLKNNPTIDLEIEQVQLPTYFFCPYAEEVAKNSFLSKYISFP